MKRLSGRTAVITGGASGIGRACALALADEGMDMVLADLDEEALQATVREVQAQGRQAWGVRTDVARAEDVRHLLQECIRLAGSVQVVMNNAGIARFGPALELSDADWEQVIDINLWGVIHGCRVFGPHLVAQGEGQLVNTASVAGLAGLPMAASYVVSKFGVVGLSEVLRFELASHGVGVTAVCPGFARTRIAQVEGATNLAQVVERFGGEPDQLARRVVRAIKRNDARVMWGPEPFLMNNLRRFSDRLYDRAGHAVGAAMRRQLQKNGTL